MFPLKQKLFLKIYLFKKFQEIEKIMGNLWGYDFSVIRAVFWCMNNFENPCSFGDMVPAHVSIETKNGVF